MRAAPDVIETSTQHVSLPAHLRSWSLVAAAQRGDAQAFGLLYERYAPAVRRYLLNRVGDHNLAEDLTSETFLRALRGIHRVRNQGHEVKAWLVTIARNCMLDHRKSATHRREFPVADIHREARYGPSPEFHLETKLLHEELARCLALLSAEQRRCVVARIIEDQSVDATATALNRSPGAVRSLQHRACRRLRELIAR